MNHSTDHRPRLCPFCDGPLTATLWCTGCDLDWTMLRKKASIMIDPFANDIDQIAAMIQGEL